MSTAWKRKDLLTIRELDRSEIELILDHARTFKDLLAKRVKKSTSLEGRTVVNLFVEPSTRTRTSFELAATRLDADVVSIDSASSSFRKGETLKDTGLVLEAMKADFVILRHSAAGAPHFPRRAAQRPRHQRRRRRARAPHPGAARHLHHARAPRRHRSTGAPRRHLRRHPLQPRRPLQRLGADQTRRARHALRPFHARAGNLRRTGRRVTHDLDSVLPDADVIMLLRIQHERQRKSILPQHRRIHSALRPQPSRVWCKPDVLIMHPGPINRGVEIASELADGPNRTVILDKSRTASPSAWPSSEQHLLGGTGN
jgi:aspartate carbamoyltransferase catalytic subunit